MDYVNAGRRLRLTYVRDLDGIDAIVFGRGPGAPLTGGRCAAPLAGLVGAGLVGNGHLVLATERSSGREQGILIAGDRETTMEPFLLLDTIPAAAAPEDPAILRRMIAVAILRMTGLGQMPGVVATRTHIPALCHALRDLGRRITPAVFHPEPGNNNIIPLTTAALAHRVARAVKEPPRFDATAAMLTTGANRRKRRDDTAACVTSMLAVLDLRAADETSVVEGARWLYRSRMRRASAAIIPMAPSQPMRSSSAT